MAKDAPVVVATSMDDSAGADVVAAAKDEPMAVEISGDNSCAGLYLRCGHHTGKPMYQRMKDETQPVYFYHWDGAGDKSCVGWYAGVRHPSKADKDEFFEFWSSEDDVQLPVAGEGSSGSSMELHSSFDAPSQAVVATLPAALRKEFLEAFTRSGNVSKPPSPTLVEGAAATPAAEAAAAAATPPPVPSTPALTSAAAAEGEPAAATATPAPDATAIAERPRSTSLPSRRSPTPARTEPTLGGTRHGADRTEAGFMTDGGISDFEAPEKVEGAGVGGLTAAALAEHSKAMPPIGGDGVAPTDGKSVARSLAGGSAIAPSAVAPSMAPTVRTIQTAATKGEELQAKGNLTAAALAAHSAVMPPIGGDAETAATKSVAAEIGRSVVQSEVTFRTHMTGRQLLVGPSVMRELMRSVSPISEPGVNVKQRKRKHSPRAVRVDPYEEVTSRVTLSPSKANKKNKKEKKEKGGKAAKLVLQRLPSHWRNSSPTPDSQTTHLTNLLDPSTSQQPSHWLSSGNTGQNSQDQTPSRHSLVDISVSKDETLYPSESVDPPPEMKRKKMKRNASPCSSSAGAKGLRARPKAKLKKRAGDDSAPVARPKKKAKTEDDRRKRSTSRRQKRKRD